MGEVVSANGSNEQFINDLLVPYKNSMENIPDFMKTATHPH